MTAIQKSGVMSRSAAHDFVLRAYPLYLLIALAASTTAIAGDPQFFLKLSENGLAEIAAGKLAVSNSDRSSVRDFGAQVVQDHTASNELLESVARRSGERTARRVGNADGERLQRLSELQGGEFDVVYIQIQIDEHNRMIELLEDESRNGTDRGARELSLRLLPEVRAHLDKTAKLAAEVSGGREPTQP